MIILCSTYFYNSYLYYRRVEKPEEKMFYISAQYNLAKKFFNIWRMLYAVLIFIKYVQTLTLPYYDKLLPENLENAIQKKKTLVVNLNKTLIKYDYRVIEF